MSTSGAVMLVGGLNGILMVSNNKGLTWQARFTDTTRFWEWTSVSADGRYMLASCFGDFAYSSSDSGATWRQLTQFSTDDIDVGFVWVSASGQQQMIGMYGGSLYISDNYGITFRDTTIEGYWYDVSVASTKQMIPFTSPGYVYQTLDGGTTLVPILADARRDFLAVSVSTNGMIITAAAANDSIFVSTNSGATWGVLNTGPRDWSSVAMTATGDIFATAVGLSQPIIWRNNILSTDSYQVDVQRSDIQLALGTNASGRTFVLGAQDGSVRVNRVSREPLTTQFAQKTCIGFDHASLDIPRPLFADTDSATDFTCIMAVNVRSTNNAPCISMSPNHYLLLSTASSGMTIKWGPSAAISVNRAMDQDQWAIIAFYIGTTVDPQYRMYVNGSKVLDRIGSVSEPSATATMRIGGSTDGNDDFQGNIGEILVYRGALQENNVGWNAVHSYLGRKFAVYAALPQLSGIGSDPHVRQLTGGTFDLSQPGDYVLIQTDAFKMTCHISSIKQGIFMDSIVITNGPHVARVTFKSRGLALSSTTRTAGNSGSSYELHEDTHETVKWDVWPTAPRRFVKVLRGRHPILGAFWLRLDYRHRYMTPYFPNVTTWRACNGILIGQDKQTRRLVKTTPKQIIRPQPANIKRQESTQPKNGNSPPAECL